MPPRSQLIRRPSASLPRSRGLVDAHPDTRASMTETTPTDDYEPSLRIAAQHLEVALRLIESEDLAADTYHGSRARLALSSALASAARQFAPFWPKAYADADGFKLAFRAVNCLRVQALDGPVEPSAEAVTVPHLRALLDAVSRALEELDRA